MKELKKFWRRGLSFFLGGWEAVCMLSVTHLSTGGTSAAKEPGHLEVRTALSQVTRMLFFPQKC